MKKVRVFAFVFLLTLTAFCLAGTTVMATQDPPEDPKKRTVPESAFE